jgi:hypothetical protein
MKGRFSRDLHEEIMPAAGYSLNGRHHEVYLSDPRKTPAAKLRTLLLQLANVK